MIRVLSCIVALIAASNSSAQSRPEPMQQLTFPTLAVGEEGLVVVQVPAWSGGERGIEYTFNMRPLFTDDTGYRAFAVDCDHPDFRAIAWDEPIYDESASCSQSFALGGKPHEAFLMTVAVRNVGALPGKTRRARGLSTWGWDADSDIVHAPWVIEGR